MSNKTWLWPQGSSPAQIHYSTADGRDFAWLVGQPWCNGRVATMGLSYSAHTQMALGALDPPGLAAQFIEEKQHPAYE